MVERVVADTLAYYDNNSEGVSEQYEKVDSQVFLGGLPLWVRSRGKILDLGCGSGRDAAFLRSKEYDVYGIDGSQAMLDEALHLHPELAGRLVKGVFPGVLPYPDESFDAVVSIAFLMHLRKEGVETMCREILRVLSPHGVFWLSVRQPSNLDESEGEETMTFDERHRFYLRLSTTRWKKIFEQQGFYGKEVFTDDDALGRNYSWSRFVFSKDH